MLKAKYGINSDIDLSSYVSDKMHIIIEAGRKLNICPCCDGTKTHTFPKLTNLLKRRAIIVKRPKEHWQISLVRLYSVIHTGGQSRFLLQDVLFA